MSDTCPVCSKLEEDCECEAPFCEACGKPCKVKWEDCGIGGYEYWGSRGTHHDWQPCSDCCDADLFEDANLTKPYKVEPEDYECEPDID